MVLDSARNQLETKRLAPGMASGRAGRDLVYEKKEKSHPAEQALVRDATSRTGSDRAPSATGE